MIAALLMCAQVPGQPQAPQVGQSHPAPRLGPDPTVRFFLSARPSGPFEHAIVGVTRLVMVAAGGDRVVFRAKRGREIDLATLVQGDLPRYEFLSRNVIPNGVYDSMRIELERRVRVTPNGAKKPVAAALTDTRYGLKMLTVAFPAPQRFDSNRNVALEFDLTEWELRGDEVAVHTITDQDTGHISQVGVVAREKVAVSDLTRQLPVTLTGFVTGPAGKASTSVYGMRQEGWILPVRFGTLRPSRGDTIQVTGIFSVDSDAFWPSSTNWLRGTPKLPPAPKPPPSKRPATKPPAIKSGS
jgi:hypothetical protein